MAAEKVTKAAPTAPNADKKRAIETAMAQIEKLYGKGSIMRCGDEQAANVEAISTGSLALDLALGIGGASPAGQGCVCGACHGSRTGAEREVGRRQRPDAGRRAHLGCCRGRGAAPGR